MATMTEIQCFSHTLHNRDISVSAVMINGEPWFRAKDIAIALGYANPCQAVRHDVDERDRSQLKDLVLRYVETHSDSEQTTSGELGSLKFRPPLQHNEGAQVFISESGLYSLNLHSDLHRSHINSTFKQNTYTT